MPMGYYCQRLPPDAGDCHSCIHPDNAIHSGSTEEDEELARVPSAEDFQLSPFERLYGHPQKEVGIAFTHVAKGFTDTSKHRLSTLCCTCDAWSSSMRNLIQQEDQLSKFVSQ
ncbi:hypothetical protein I311_06545 [Cryptococcus gattii NT-10]|nr:hypothetical protein I311_06545 [Cryptococcus gattii NT-10]